MTHARSALRSMLAAFVLFVPAPAFAADDERPMEKRSNAYMSYERPREWTLRTLLQLDLRCRELPGGVIDCDRPVVREGSLIFPLVRESSFSIGDPERARGELQIGSVVVADRFTLIDGYHSNAEYARFDILNALGVRWRLTLTYPMVSYETVFDEEAAMRVPWPEGDWPPDAEATFGPQMFVDLLPTGDRDVEPIRALVAEWTQGQDPRSIPPVMLAKYFAGRVQEHVLPDRPALLRGGLRRGPFAGGPGLTGLNLQGAGETARSGRGTTHDMAALLVAVYRAAGLPARIVIGYDKTERQEERRIRSWAEFCLYDEANDLEVWVPVDVARMRRSSSRMRPMNQPWRFFGTHDELREIAPIAMHFHPPTTVRSFEAPAFYGVMFQPAPAGLGGQVINFDTFRTPQRGGRGR